MTYDLNDAEPQRSGLIDPCHAKIVGVLRPGGVDGPAPTDRGLLKPSKSSADVLMLDWEFTVAEGPNARRKFWQTMVVAGGEVDEKGQSKGWNISKSLLRAMVDSGLGLNPKDESESARQRRMLRGFADLNGIGFVARIGVKKDKDGKYPDQNILAHIVTPDEKEWQMVMSGQEVPVGGATAAKPQGWGQNAWGGASAPGPSAQPQQNQWGSPPPAAAPAPAPQPGWPAQAAVAPQAPPPGWPPATAPSPTAPAPAPGQGWSAPQPAGWPPAAQPAAAPVTAPAAPGAMPGPAWLNG
ncbi:MAG: hypothetical protein WCF85_09185 [Rhodospirillaceae bacterium]